MSNPPISIISWPRLTSVAGTPKTLSDWDAVCKYFTLRQVVLDKMHACGFGPYELKNITGPRHNDNVLHVTMAVFDADAGPIEPCLEKLDQANIAWLAYTTWSHTPEKSCWRLAIPLATPCLPANWGTLRLALLKAFVIPADPAQCSGVSHFYFRPSHPPLRDAVPAELRRSRGDGYLDSGAYSIPPAKEAPVVEASPAKLGCAVSPFVLQAPPPQARLGEVVDPHTIVLQRLAAYPEPKHGWLKAVASGTCIAPHGFRNTAMARTVASLVWMLSPFGVTPEQVLILVEPCLKATQNAGSKLTSAAVERMIRSSQVKWDAYSVELLSISSAFWGQAQNPGTPDGCA